MTGQLVGLLGIVAIVYWRRERRIRRENLAKARTVLRSTEHAAVRLKPRPTGDVTVAPINPPVPEFLFGGQVIHLHPKVIPFPTDRDRGDAA